MIIITENQKKMAVMLPSPATGILILSPVTDILIPSTVTDILMPSTVTNTSSLVPDHVFTIAFTSNPFKKKYLRQNNSSLSKPDTCARQRQIAI